MLTEQALLIQIKQWKAEMDELEDFIDSGYLQVDTVKDKRSAEEITQQINQWKQRCDELEDLVESSYLELEEMGDMKRIS